MRLLQSTLLLLLLPVLLHATSADSAPIVSDEVVLDHGRRYHIDTANEGCSIGLYNGVLLLSYGTVGSNPMLGTIRTGVMGFRRNLVGEPIDLSPRNIAPMEYEEAGDHDISAFDGVGWKVVYVTGSQWILPNALRVGNLDPTTLHFTPRDAALTETANSELHHPIISFCDTHHVIAWVEENRILLTRMLADMTLLDPEPLEVASGVSEGSIGLAVDGRGGLLGWIDEGGALYVQSLSGEGLPSGQARRIEQGPDRPIYSQVSLDRFGDGWLAAWSFRGDAPLYALLDADGAPRRTGVVQIPVSSSGVVGLATSASPDLAVIAWREQFGEVLAAGVDGEGEPAYPQPIVISQSARLNSELRQLRNLDCEWTGDSFVIVWNMLFGFDEFGSGSGGVEAQWLLPDGSTRFSEPVDITHGSSPQSITPMWIRDNYVVSLEDRFSADAYHFVADGRGNILSGSHRFENGGYGGDPVAVGFGSRAVILRRYQEFRDYYEADGLKLTWVNDTGNVLSSRALSLLSLEGHIDTYVGSAARHGESHIAVALRVHERDVGYEALIWLGPGDATRLHEGRWWRTRTGGILRSPALASLGEAILLVWSEERGDVFKLYRAILGPSDPSEIVVGERFVPGEGSQEFPRLADGPGLSLCTFVVSTPHGDPEVGLYGVRLSDDGRLVDEAPVLIAQGERPIYAKAVWDGRTFLVTWSERAGGSYRTFGNRITFEGEVLDGEGFLVSQGGSTRTRLATDGEGQVLVAIGSSKLRWIDDTYAYPLPTDDEPSLLQISLPQPNPSSGSVRLLLSAPEPGARLEVLDIRGRLLNAFPIETGIVTWNGRLDSGRRLPAGTYYVRLKQGSRASIGRRVTVVR